MKMCVAWAALIWLIGVGSASAADLPGSDGAQAVTRSPEYVAMFQAVASGDKPTLISIGKTVNAAITANAFDGKCLRGPNFYRLPVP